MLLFSYRNESLEKPQVLVGNVIPSSPIPSNRSGINFINFDIEESTAVINNFNNISDDEISIDHPIDFMLTGIQSNISGMTGSPKEEIIQDVVGNLGEGDGINVRRMIIGYDNPPVSRNEVGIEIKSNLHNISLSSIKLMMRKISGGPGEDDLWRNTTIELRENEPNPVDQPDKTSTIYSIRLNDTDFLMTLTTIQEVAVNFGEIILDSNTKYWVVINATKVISAFSAYLGIYYYNDTSNDLTTSNRTGDTVTASGDSTHDIVYDAGSWPSMPVFDPYLKMNYEITDPLDVDEVSLNGTLGGVKQSFTKTGTGEGSAYWSGLSLPGPTTTIYTEANDSVRYNASVLSYFTRNSSSISYDYMANETGTYWNSTFNTDSVGDSYNFTARYHPSWSNIKISRNGSDVTGSVSISNGEIIVPDAIAAGDNSWTITAESPNRVSSLSFDQSIYYRGQTFSVSVTNNMTTVDTELVQYYDPSGVQRGATIGDNFPLGNYTAVYWCENGTDAGFATATVLVTDNGSISVHLTDNSSRNVPNALVNITELNRTGYTDLLGRVTFTDVLFGNYTVEFSSMTRGDLGSSPVIVDGDGVQLADKFSDGFPASITITNTSDVLSTTLVSGTASGGGFFSCLLDEGSYAISVEYPAGTGIALNSSAFIVVKDSSTSFSFIATSLDAHPSLHSGHLVAGINDSPQSGTTGATGDAEFDIYWGSGDSVNITFSDSSGPLGTISTFVNVTGDQLEMLELPYQYFLDVSFDIIVEDKFGSGFPGTVVIYNETGGRPFTGHLSRDQRIVTLQPVQSLFILSQRHCHPLGEFHRPSR
jgi:hypothetical protein